MILFKTKPSPFISIWILCGSLTGFLGQGCSSAPPTIKKAYIPPHADPQAEFNQLNDSILQGESEQLYLFSPEAFQQAKSYYLQARAKIKRNPQDKSALELIAYAQGAIERAFERGTKVSTLLGQVASARSEAIESGAETYAPKDLKSIDRRVINIAKKLEQGDQQAILDSIHARAKLKEKYQALSLEVVKRHYLGESKAELDALRSIGAQHKTPDAFDRFYEKYTSLQDGIDANRYNSSFLDLTLKELKNMSDQMKKEIQD